jgi:single-strand DNA-binding protein
MSLQITGFGRLGSDPEIKQAKKVTVATASVAINHDRKDSDGNYQADWYRLNVWGGQADFFKNQFSKGARVYFSGNLEINHYTTKNGEQRETKDIFVNKLNVVDWQQSTQAHESFASGEEIDSEDLPF